MSEKTQALQQKSAYVVLILVLICLVCTLLLAFAKDIFAVSDETKFNRSMAKIYEGFVKDSDVPLEDDPDIPAYGEVKSIVKATDGGYVVEVVGNGGYKDGTVTLYVAFSANKLIKGWAIKDSVNQSFVSKITDAHTSTWYIPVNETDYTLPDSYPLGNNKATGATYTSTAINHAINVAVYYANHHLFGANGEVQQ